MTRRAGRFALAGLIVASPLGAAAYPGPMKGCGGGGQKGKIECLTRCLHLTENQKKEAEKLASDGEAAVLRLKKKMRRAEHDLQGEMMKDKPDASKVRKLAEQAGTVLTEMRVLRLEKILAFRQILTPEQLDKMLACCPGDGPCGPGASCGSGFSGACGGHGRGGCGGPAAGPMGGCCSSPWQWGTGPHGFSKAMPKGPGAGCVH